GDAQLVKGLFDVGGHVVPRLLGVVLERAQVIEDIFEVDLGQVSRGPGRHRLLAEDVERAQAELEHPFGFLLERRNLLDDLRIESATRLERVLFGVAEPVFVVLGEILRFNGHGWRPPLLLRCPGGARWGRSPRTRAAGQARLRRTRRYARWPSRGPGLGERNSRCADSA